MSENIIIRAASYAKWAHAGQYRKHGPQIPYITHPARVAARTMCLNYIPDMVAVAWLHDVVEDCGVALKKIEQLFNTYIVYGIDCLTNKSKYYPHLSRGDRKAMDREYIRNIPSEFKLIKMIDRIDNLRDMMGAPYEFKRLYITESELLVRESGLFGLDEELDNEYNYTIVKLQESL